jgi:hypothetical protein
MKENKRRMPSDAKSPHCLWQQTWPPQAILVSDWPIFFKSPPLKPLGQINRKSLSVIEYTMKKTERRF